MSASKNKKASKQNAKTASKAAAQTVQLDFLPKVPVYPAELLSATEPMVRLGDQTWVRVASIVNPPDPAMNRYTEPEWADFLDSIRTFGQKSACHFRTVEGGFWLEDGRHRVLALTELGWAYVKADVDAQGNAASSAAWRFEANARRKEDRPLDLAVTWAEMMDPKGAALTQEQVAQLVKASPATVSRTLRLLEIPRELASLVGSKLDGAWLEPVFSVRGDAALLEAASNAVLASAEKNHVRSADDVHRLMAHAWTEKELAVPEESFNAEIRDEAAWKKARSTLKPFKVKVPQRYGDGKPIEVVYLRDLPAAMKVAQEVSDRLDAEERAEEERLRRKAAKAGKKVKKEPDGSLKVVEPPAKRSLAERVPEQRTKVQLDLLARFVPAQLAFPSEMLGEVLGRFVKHTSSLMALQDIEAACHALGLPVPEKPERGIRSFEFRRGDFAAAWKRDPAAGWRWVAVALFFQARDGEKQLQDGTNHTPYSSDKGLEEPRLPVWLTGKTFDEATEIAKQAIKDRDAGFKAVVDGALCDHCDEPATLRREGVNVCRSEVFKGINKDPKALATLRLRRKEAKAAQAAQDAPAAPEGAEPAQPAMAVVEAGPGPEAPQSVPVEPADKASAPSEPAQDAPAPAGKRKGRKAAAGA